MNVKLLHILAVLRISHTRGSTLRYIMRKLRGLVIHSCCVYLGSTKITLRLGKYYLGKDTYEGKLVKSTYLLRLPQGH